MEHRHTRPFADDDGHAARRARRGTRWRTDAAAVGVGATPRRRVPSRSVAAVVDAPVLLGSIRIRNLNDAADADVLVDERGGRRTRGHPRPRPGTARLSHGVPERPARRADPGRRRRRRDVPVAPRRTPPTSSSTSGRRQRPWIAAVDGDGSGVAHVSTSQLRGRKLFVWGTGRGGQRWQEWLSHGGDEVYAEIQAGLAPTQFEHLMMPARAEWRWTEAFGADRRRRPAQPRRPTGTTRSATSVRPSTSSCRSTDSTSWHRAGGRRRRPSARRRRSRPGPGGGRSNGCVGHAPETTWFDDTGTPFPDDSLGAEQEPWLDLAADRDASAVTSPGSAAALLRRRWRLGGTARRGAGHAG